MRTLTETAQAASREEQLRIIEYHADIIDGLAEKALGPHNRREFDAQASAASSENAAIAQKRIRNRK